MITSLRQRLPLRVSALLIIAGAFILLAGCGGGGGGSSSPSGNTGTTIPTTPTPQTSQVSVSGTLRDSSSGTLLRQRTVKVTASGSTYSGTTDDNGHFQIGNVPVTTITVSITDSNGTVQGSTLTYNLALLSGNPRLLTANDSSNKYINIDVSQLPGLPPI